MKNKRCFATRMSVALCALLLGSNPGVLENAGMPGDVSVVLAEERGRTYEEYRSGAGTEVPVEAEDYTEIHISTEEDFADFARNCELDSWSLDKYVVLDGDIVLSKDFGYVIPSFGGIFEGNGHKISNLRIGEAGSAQGLFRYIREGAVVRNLSVAGRVQPEGSQSQVGILAGVNYGSILNCSVAGSVAGDQGVGGIAGVNEAAGEIRRCSSSAMVTGTHGTGGICGENKGVLNNCSNSGEINIYSKEVTYDLDDITMENLENLNSTSNFAAHTDTGGIVGYSEGKIYYCTNTGTVGYQHVGYNTGGIAGRLHQGYVQNCTNFGKVYGRKDVGGIVGQMEPFLEIQYLNDKLQEIDRETDRLFDLLEQTNEDLEKYGDEASSLAGSVTASLQNVSGAAGSLTGTANYLWYLYNQELTGINSDLQRLNSDLKEQSEAAGTKDFTIDLGGSVSGGDLGDITVEVPDNTEGYRAALRRFGESATGHISNMTGATADRSGGITENLDLLNRELQSAADNLQKLADVLGNGADQAGNDMDAVAAQARVLRKSISELRDDLFRYEGITVADASDEAAGNESGSPGSEVGDGAAETTGGAAGETTGEAAGETTGGAAGETTGDAAGETSGSAAADSEDALYDTTSFQQGKITLCVNEGKVEADTNVGGIVGQIATEYDFDPEDDISLTGDESFNLEQTVKAIVRESLNKGSILGKKDYVGGIVGKADYGAVISCESYGEVSSSGGSYVGGIAGASDYAVRSCYFLGKLSGKNYVGGIAGKGCDIFYSYASPVLEMTGECGGSVAGRLSEDGVLAGNYYAEGNIPGVDSVGYEGGATPLAYDVFCNMEGVPEAFRVFTVRFVADGEEIGAYTCGYGEALDVSQIPAAPVKEGYYSVWPDADFDNIRSNLVLEAEYMPWISSLASEETDADGRTLVLVQGQFKPGVEVLLKETPEGTALSLCGSDGSVPEEYKGPVTVRVLCENAENGAVELYADGAYRTAETTVIGSYLEFQMENPGCFRVTVEQDDGSRWILVTAVVAGAVVLLVILLAVKVVGKHKKKRKAKDPGSVKAGGGTGAEDGAEAGGGTGAEGGAETGGGTGAEDGRQTGEGYDKGGNI